MAGDSVVVVDHEVLGSVTICRTTRARRVSLRITSSGAVRLTFPLRGPNSGVAFAMEFLESKVEWVLRARARVLQASVERKNLAPRSEAEIDVLRLRAKEYLPGRLALLAREHGFVYGRVTIRATRSKWGSCSGANDISLSLFLMTLPSHLIDFILLHELCHTVHHNHSAAFHALVDRCVGGCERALIKELRGYSPR